MYYRHAPKTCRNFVELARRGYYDNVIFHRIIKVSPEFPISCWLILVCLLSISDIGYVMSGCCFCCCLGFHCARWGSYRNRQRWRVHLWVSSLLTPPPLDLFLNQRLRCSHSYLNASCGNSRCVPRIQLGIKHGVGKDFLEHFSGHVPTDFARHQCVLLFD